MSLTSILPAIAGIFIILFIVIYTIFRDKIKMKNSWLLPAILSFMFLLFSIFAGISGGAFGFWAEHTRNMRGNQIWFDLLMAVGIGWFLIVPKAKVQGMRLLPLGILVVCTGCIGFMAMVARMLYLQERSGNK